MCSFRRDGRGNALCVCSHMRLYLVYDVLIYEQMLKPPRPITITISAPNPSKSNSYASCNPST